MLKGQYSGWNSGYQAGFGSFSIAYISTGIAYIMLIFCIAEMTSALPFAGGAWGKITLNKPKILLFLFLILSKFDKL